MKLIKSAIILTVFIGLQLSSNDQISPDLSRYKTATPDNAIYNVPQSIIADIRSGKTTDLKPLVDSLTKGTTDPFQKAKIIHDWITENIAYDNDSFYGKNKEGEILKDFRATCGGFADLFRNMTTLAGIETIKIQGKSKVTYDTKIKSMASHVWNAVKINNNWHIVDTTHDSRFSFTNGSYSTKSKFRDTQLFIHPDAKILDNIPDNPDYQFIKKPWTMTDFLSHPKVNPARYTNSNISFESDMNKLITRQKNPDNGDRFLKIEDVMVIRSEPVAVKIKSPENISIAAKVLDDKGKIFDSYSFCYRESDITNCIFSAPDSGNYSAYLSSKDETKEKLYNKFYEFNIISEKSGLPQLPPEFQLFKLGSFTSYGLKIKKEEKEK